MKAIIRHVWPAVVLSSRIHFFDWTSGGELFLLYQSLIRVFDYAGSYWQVEESSNQQRPGEGFRAWSDAWGAAALFPLCCRGDGRHNVDTQPIMLQPPACNSRLLPLLRAHRLHKHTDDMLTCRIQLNQHHKNLPTLQSSRRRPGRHDAYNAHGGRHPPAQHST